MNQEIINVTNTNFINKNFDYINFKIPAKLDLTG